MTSLMNLSKKGRKAKDSRKKRELRQSWDSLKERWAGESVSGRRRSAGLGATSGSGQGTNQQEGAGQVAKNVSAARNGERSGHSGKPFLERMAEQDPRDDGGTKKSAKTYTGRGAIVPLHKSNYTVVTDVEDLKGLGKNPK